ncbi:MAG: serine/threonine protein kinase, partial [Planctomycetota bacterium]
MGNDEVNNKSVTDENDVCYQLKEKIGEGGQGTVWTTQFDDVLVKLANKKLEKERPRYYRRLKYQQLRMDLPHL